MSNRSAAHDQLAITAEVSKDALRDALAIAGLRRLPGAAEIWRGALRFHTGECERQTVVEVLVVDSYPWQAPVVTPLERAITEAALKRTLTGYHDASWGWHRDRDGAMCLFVDDDQTRLPWADGSELVEQARAWLAADAAGWASDVPALDLERYLRPAPKAGVVLYGELPPAADNQVRRLHRHANYVLRVRGLAAPQRSGRRGSVQRWKEDAILVLNAGELTAPIRGWRDLLGASGSESTRLERLVASGLRHVLVRYRRATTNAVLVLDVRPQDSDDPAVTYLTSAPDDAATRQLRAHPRAVELANCRVTVVGVGAVGSVVADLLARDGVGALHLVDPDVLLPGNTTRHLLDDRHIGRFKATAVADVLNRAHPACTVTAQTARVSELDDAVLLLSDADLVVDSTADSSGTPLLAAAARAEAGQLLSVCVLADGHAVRVDRIPTVAGAPAVPQPELPPPDRARFETGCGSPVSSTPPAAAWEAAAVAARHATGLLLDPERVAAGEVRLLSSGAAA